MTFDAASPDDSPTDRESRPWVPGLRIVSLTTFASRILGLVRDIAMAALFGNGVVMDAFSIAFKIPNIARRLFGEGAVTAAFLPAFVHEREHIGEPAAYRLATAVLGSLLLWLSALVAVCEAILLSAITLFDWSWETQLLLGLTAVLLPYLVLICLTAQGSAVLHASGQFFVPAVAPIVLNAVWIAAVWTLAPAFSDQVSQIYIISVSLVIAGFLQLGLVAAALSRSGFRFMGPDSDSRRKVRRIVTAMAPVVLGLSITQLNTLSDSVIAWAYSAPDQSVEVTNVPHNNPGFELPSGTAASLYFGQRMYQFPLGVFGVALGTVLFPTLAQHAGRQDTEPFQRALILALRLVAFIGVPASAGLVVLAEPLSVLLFQRGAFDEADAAQTAQMIAAYGVGVWAYCALLILLRAYYALGDRMTPVRVGLLAVGLNLSLNFGLMFSIGAVGLACSTAVTAMCEAGLNGWLLQSRIGRVKWQELRSTVGRCVIATSLMIAVCLASLHFVTLVDLPFERLMRVLIPLAASIVTYLLASHWLGMDELQLLLGSRSRRN